MTNTRQRVLIVGYGYVGSQLASVLEARGHDVTGLCRKPEARPVSHRLLKADVCDPESLTQLKGRFDRIVYAVSPGSRDDTSYERAYPLGLENVLRASEDTPTVFVSSTAVYAQQDGATVDESSPAEARSFSALRLRQAESLLHGSSKHIVVRASGIYGPGRTRLITRLVHDSLAPAEREILTSRVHRDDLAGIIAYLLDANQSGGLYIASDPHPSSLGEMQDWLRSNPAGEKLKAQAGASASPPTRQRSSRQIHPTRLLKEGYSFRFPSFREGYSQLLLELP